MDLLENELFPNISEEAEGRVDVEKLLLGLKRIVSNRRSIISDIDGAALSAIRRELTGMLGERIVPIEEAIKIIRGNIFDIRICSESIEPGKIHFTGYKNADWLDRKQIYFVGLDANYFPGLIIEDPILLDCERMAPLKTSKEIFYKKLEYMDRTLKNIKWNVIFSYPYYDTIDNRRISPSTIFNQLYEKRYGEDQNYIETRDFLVDIDSCLDSEDYFIHHAINSGPILKDDYEDSLSHSMRLPFDFNYNFSPSMFKTYINCQYQFFLKYVLKLKEISDEKIDVLGWLSHFEIGHVYHRILEDFCSICKDDMNILSQAETANAKIKEIASKIILEYEEILPSGSGHKVKMQTQEILNNCEMFADKEVDMADSLEYIAFEEEFGKTDPCDITLDDGSKISINGIIDRIHKVKGKDEYVICDYKTGSTWGYSELENAKELIVNEHSIQLMVYYLAMAKKYNISKASYRFVTSKGDYKTIDLSIDEESEKKFIEIISGIIEQMHRGEFNPKAEGNKDGVCDYCGYLKSCIYASKEMEAYDE